jgi:hypothetical protein
MKQVAVRVGHSCHPLSPFPVGRLVNDRPAIIPQALDLTIDVVGVKPEVTLPTSSGAFVCVSPIDKSPRVTTRNAASPLSGKR